MRKGLLLCVLLLALPFVFAQSANEILEYGYGPLGIHQAELNADYTNDPLQRFDAPAPGGWLANHEDIPPIAGDFDGDGIPEIPFHISGQVQFYHFIGDDLQLAYSNLQNGSAGVSVISNSQLFHDVDNDGDMEYFACGVTGGESHVVGYDYNKTTQQPQVLWEHRVTGETLGCVVLATDNLKGTAYAPSAYVQDGEHFGIFAYESTITGERIGLLKINLQNGSFFKIVQAASSACGGAGVIEGAGASNGAIEPRGVITNSPETYTYSKVAVCADPADSSNKVAYLVADCQGVPNIRGVLAIDLGLFVNDASFGTDGWAQIGNGDSSNQLSSPACFQKTTGERMAILTYEDGTGDMDIQEADQSGLSSIAEASFPIDYDYISDMIQGEFSHPTNDNFDDVCVMAQDYDTGDAYFYCVDIDNPLLADEVTAIRTGPGAGYNNIDLRAQLITHTPESDLAGDSRDEIVTNLGVFSAVPDKDFIGYTFQSDDFLPDGPSLVDGPTFLEREGLQHLDNTYDYIPGVCASLDFNNDTFADIFCYTDTNITYFISSSVVPNSPPIILVNEVTPIPNRCQAGSSCSLETNTTVTYNLSYIDADNDLLYYAYDCDTRFAPGATVIQTTNTTASFQCEYDITGNALTRVYGNDDADYALFKDINVTVTEIGGLLCDFDGVFEPLFGETEENCLPDFEASQTLEDANATASEAQQATSREAFLTSVGVNPNAPLYEVSFVDGEVVKSGSMEDMKSYIWRLFNYLLALFPYILIGIIVLGVIIFFIGGKK